MQRDMDCIKFEYRYEIEEVVEALETYAQEHKKEDNVDTVKKLIRLLDVMHMNW